MSADKIQNEQEAVKCCTKCGEEKPLSEFGYRNRKLKDGTPVVRVQSQCPKCRYEVSKRTKKARDARRRARPEVKAYQKDLDRKRYVDNKDSILERNKKWKKENPLAHSSIESRRRCRNLSAEGAHTTEQLKARFDFHGNKCIYCGSGERLEIEHMIPLSKGGTNWPSNLAPACKSCNSSKNAGSFWEFSGKKRPRG